MEVPETLVERDIQCTAWTDDPNIDCIQLALATKGYDHSSLEKQTMSRYTLHRPLGPACSCLKHTITVTRDILLQSCRCNVQVLGPTTREAVKRQLDEDIRTHNYVKQYFSPQMDPTTRTIMYRASCLWVQEALIVNTIQRNISLNNMQDELFRLLRDTGYTMVNVHDESGVPPE